MLLELTVRRLAIIDDLTLALGPGLNVLTGETGAGKSILVGALSLAVGARAGSESVRAGESSAEVEAVFDLTSLDGLRASLEAEGLAEDGRLIVRRVISADGPNKVYLGGRNTTQSRLAELGPALVSVYGQHDYRGLLSADEHLAILDEFAGAVDERGRTAAAFARVVELDRRVSDLRERAQRAVSRADYLDFVIREIEAARLEPGEDERLRERRRVLVSAEKLARAGRAVLDGCWEAEGSVADACGALVRQADEARAIDTAFEPVAQALSALALAAQEAGESARAYLETLELEPGELERIDDRLDAIRLLCKKYGAAVADVLQTLDDSAAERAAIGNLDADIAAAERERARALEELDAAAKALTKTRRKGAGELTTRMAKQLSELGMKKAGFEVRFSDPPEGAGADVGGRRVDAAGAERGEFLLAANPGEPPRPLAKIASGGELSRIMLALKNSLAAASFVPSLVFDEVDAGVGGAQAEIIGAKLKAVAERHQVLCITHLPQIAGFADRHIAVRKEVIKGRTRTHAEPLDPDSRIRELARMLGGLEITDATLAAAREMIR